MLVTIAFAGEPDRDLVLRLEPDTSLRQVRERLAALDAMAPGIASVSAMPAWPRRSKPTPSSRK